MDTICSNDKCHFPGPCIGGLERFRTAASRRRRRPRLPPHAIARDPDQNPSKRALGSYSSRGQDSWVLS